MMWRIFLSAILFIFMTSISHAVQPDEMLSDPALEARARTISKELRCLVCQNESIDDSNADLAYDLRTLVRQRLSAGDNDQQVTQYIVHRYGQYVLLKPPFDKTTFILWLGPPIVLIAGIWGVIFFYRQRMIVPDALTPGEMERVEKLIRETEQRDP